MSSDEDEGGPKNMRFSAARDFDNLTEIGGEFYGMSWRCIVRINSCCFAVLALTLRAHINCPIIVFSRPPRSLECAGTQRQGRRQTKEQQLYGVFADDDEETDWNSKPPERPAFTCVWRCAPFFISLFCLCMQLCSFRDAKWSFISRNVAKLFL